MAVVTQAVHFGAGNIGRGFVGLLLADAGYEVIFADVNAELIDALADADSYVVHEIGSGSVEHTVTGFRALNSATDEAAVVAAVAAADIATTAVGPNVLRFIAPVIAKALAERPADAPRLAVMACENAIGATDTLRAEVARLVDDPALLERAVFANTAVDRIVPAQAADAGLSVAVETYHEWVIDASAFARAGVPRPPIPGAHFVDDLAPYIERKLYTVNTGHATIAYHGAAAGALTIADALEVPAVEREVRAVLAETKAMLVAKHGVDPDAQQAYLEKILARFREPALTDPVARVGRQPLRKLSRHERFIGPAAELAERGLGADALLRAIGAALAFRGPADEQSVELERMLDGEAPETVVAEVTGIEPGHPLYPGLLAEVTAAQAG